MTRLTDEPRSWPSDADPEAVLNELRRQLEAMKAHLEEHRLQMWAAGLTSDRSGAEGA